jgi:hypothetical protein
MTNNPCPCSNLDWREVDMSLEHHPYCQFGKRYLHLKNDLGEVQTVEIDAPPAYKIFDSGSALKKLLSEIASMKLDEVAAYPFDGTNDSIRVASYPDAFWISPLQAPDEPTETRMFESIRIDYERSLLYFTSRNDDVYAMVETALEKPLYFGGGLIRPQLSDESFSGCILLGFQSADLTYGMSYREVNATFSMK